PTFAHFRRRHGHHTWNDLRRGYRWNRDSTAVLFRPTQPRGCRNLAEKPWFSTTVRLNATRTSSSDFSSVSTRNRSSKAPGARQDCKRDLRRVKVKNFGIWSKYRGDSAEFSAELYGKFKKKLK
ncbi:hypothetical protein Prudu_005757, partial [Prunus dulcis]